MKALLIKDLCLLSQQKKFFGTIVLLSVFLNFYSSDTFAISYLTFVSSFFVINSIAYDEYENGFRFLYTLPIRWNTYVRSKYVFASVLCMLSWLMGCLVSMLCYLLKNESDKIQGGITEASMILPLILIFLAVVIPIILKFGTEKGRTTLAVIICGCGFLGYMIVKTGQMETQIIEMLDRLFAQPGWILASVIGAVTVVILGISYWVSVAVMRGKEF